MISIALHYLNEKVCLLLLLLLLLLERDVPSVTIMCHMTALYPNILQGVRKSVT
jgi:hypothetical protein